MRRVGEWVLRVLSFALLGVLLMRVWSPLGHSARAESATGEAVASSLPRWSKTSPGRIHLSLDSTLTPVERDWFAAIAHSGSVVTWEAPNIVPVAAVLTRVVDPVGVSELDVSAPAKRIVEIRGPAGGIDTVTAGNNGVRVVIPGAATGMTMYVGATKAVVAKPDSVIFRKLLVEGSASWETKFTIKALTERGWSVDALTHVAPGVDVREGDPMVADTARYAAIIAVDSTAALIRRGADAFVRKGGGLVTLSDASAIGPSASTATVLEKGSAGEIRAIRVGNGRVIHVTYKDLWRRRMATADSVDDPVAAHRELLANIVASVALAPRVAASAGVLADPAPLADMVARLGRRSALADAGSPLGDAMPTSVLFGILIASLLLEHASRRLRGAL
ncbi:MAG: hypothetical protein ABI035_00155 [Gemmatimonadaceae bacterium]